MRSVMRLAMVGLCAAAIGCGHDSWSEQRREAGARVSGSFDQAYEAVRSGARDVARHGEYVIDRTAEGIVRVYREARGETPQAPDAASDATVTTAVRASLQGDPQLDARGVAVDTDAGVVTLSGTVPTPQQASRAVEDATRAPGVYAVNSKLGYGPPPPSPGRPPTTMRW